VNADRTRLLGDALSLRATRERPSGAGVVDGKRAGREAKEVVVGLVEAHGVNVCDAELVWSGREKIRRFSLKKTCSSLNVTGTREPKRKH